MAHNLWIQSIKYCLQLGYRSDGCLQIRGQNSVDIRRISELIFNFRSISTLITPLVASHLHLLIVCRVLLGLGEGLGLFSIHTIIFKCMVKIVV